MKKFTLQLLLILAFISCGKKESGGGEAPVQEQYEPEGLYKASLEPVNPKFSENMKGTVTVMKFGDDLNVRVTLKNAPSGIHIQGIYSGDKCPDQDLNSDGFIDITETKKSSGDMLIPFDGDLSGQVEGNDFYPDGSYVYERSTSYDLLMSDLLQKDFPVAEMTKLKSSSLKLDGGVVIVQGISDDQSLPESVQSIGQKNAQRTIPIACGILAFTPEGDETPEVEVDPPSSPVRVRPSREIEYEPEPAPEYEEDKPEGGFWGRLRDRIRGWWRRLGGRPDDEYKPDDQYSKE